jgi:hypothetical protein
MFLQYTLAVIEMILLVLCGRWHLAFDVLFSKKSIKKVFATVAIHDYQHDRDRKSKFDEKNEKISSIFLSEICDNAHIGLYKQSTKVLETKPC